MYILDFAENLPNYDWPKYSVQQSAWHRQCEIFRVGSTLKKTMVEPQATGGELSGSQTESIRGEIKIKIKIKVN